jgi:competence protein ComEC
MSTVQIKPAAPRTLTAPNNVRAASTPLPGTRYQPLVIILIAACAGIVADRYAWPIAPRSFQAWLIVAVIALAIWWVLRWTSRDFAAGVLLLIAIAAAAGARHHDRWNLYREDELGRFATEAQTPICLEAICAGAPQVVPPPSFDPLRSIPASPHSRMDVNVVAVRDGRIWRTASGTTRIIIDHELQGIHAGDRLRIFGDLDSPLPAENPGEFDNAVFARGRRELSIVRVKLPDCISVLEPGSALNPTRWIDETRRAGDHLLWSYLSRDRAGLAAAVLLGEREEVDRETNEAFLETGTIHILCIAGLHMGILAWLLFMIFGAGWLPRRVAIVCVMAIAGFYMVLTESEPPVVRATILIWIVCGGMLLGRARIGLNSLAFAALVFLVLNPADLFHTGVQLSFLSVAVLIWAAEHLLRKRPLDPLNRLIAATRPWPERILRRLAHGAKETFVVGAILWIFIAPLTMSRFHLFSPAALLLNVVLIPALGVTMAAGLGVLVFGAWLVPLASMFAWICNAGLSFIDWSVKLALHVPAARLWVPGASELWLALFYLGLAAIVLMPKWLPPMRWRAALVGGWCGVGLIAAGADCPPAHQLRCTFIAVGHGGAELLELPDGKTLLYDAGRLGQPIGGAQSISSVLWSRGISHLDAVVISHADTDHYNSLPELLRRFSVGAVYVSPVMFKHESPALKILRRTIDDSGTALDYLAAGDRLRLDGGVSIDVLNPPPQGIEGNDNANCIVISVEYTGRRILLTGDIAAPGIEMVMNEIAAPCNVLQAPHHGSAYSAPESFATWSNPQFVIVCGSKTDGQAARTVYESHGAKVLNTADVGAITVTIDASGVDVQAFRTPSARDKLQ